MSTNKVKGFSILELMIVVTIIGILASVAVQKWREYQSKTRDNIRKTHLTQLVKALELYYIQNKAYPITPNNGYLMSTFRDLSGEDSYIPNLAPRFIDQLPEDPLADVAHEWNGYFYKSDGVMYKLLSNRGKAELPGGPESYPAKGEFFYDPIRPTQAYMLCEGATACTTW